MNKQEQSFSKQLEDHANLLLSVRKELIAIIEQQTVILTNKVATILTDALSLGKGIESELSSSKATKGNLVNVSQPPTNQPGSGSFQGTPPTTYVMQHSMDSTLLHQETGRCSPTTVSVPALMPIT